MEQLLPFVVLGIGLVAVLTFLRSVLSVMRFAVLVLLICGLGLMVVNGKVPFVGKAGKLISRSGK